jgi:hypothetical protein
MLLLYAGNLVEECSNAMANTEIQIVSSESGESTAVIARVELWRKIESERETRLIYDC